MKCIRAAWLLRCCTEGEPVGTAETAGSTRRYRSVSTGEPIIYDRSVESSLTISRTCDYGTFTVNMQDIILKIEFIQD